MQECCQEMDEFMRRMKYTTLPIRNGEGIIVVTSRNIHFEDGWNFYPTLELRFCPFCGADRKLHNTSTSSQEAS